MRLAGFLLVWLALAAPLAALEVGQTAPNFRFSRYWNVPATHDELTDFRGGVVFLVQLATWSDSSMKALDHLGELHKDYKGEGFQVLAAALDPEKDIDDVLVKHFKVEIGVVARNISMLYKYTGYPHSWLLDRSGVCIWKGPPAELLGGMVSDFMVDNPPLVVERKLATQLLGAVRAFNKGEIGKAIEETNKALEKSGAQSVKDDCAYVTELCNKHIKKWETRIKKADKNLEARVKAMQEGAPFFKGLEFAEQWTKEAAELKKTKEYDAWVVLNRLKTELP